VKLIVVLNYIGFCNKRLGVLYEYLLKSLNYNHTKCGIRFSVTCSTVLSISIYREISMSEKYKTYAFPLQNNIIIINKYALFF